MPTLSLALPRARSDRGSLPSLESDGRVFGSRHLRPCGRPLSTWDPLVLVDKLRGYECPNQGDPRILSGKPRITSSGITAGATRPRPERGPSTDGDFAVARSSPASTRRLTAAPLPRFVVGRSFVQDQLEPCDPILRGCTAHVRHVHGPCWSALSSEESLQLVGERGFEPLIG